MGRQKVNHKSPYLPYLSLLLTTNLAFLQACGNEFQSFDNHSGESLHNICVEKGGHNTYVIDKNSVYAKKEVSSLVGPDYNHLPLKPAHLLFLNTSGYLQNETFRILSYTGQQVSTTDCPLKFNYEEDHGVALSQLNSYYYSSLARQFSSQRKLFLLGQGIYIITQAPVTGWSSADNTIYLGRDPETEHDSGLDASILLGLIAEANIYYATQGAIYEDSQRHQRDCRGEQEMCCSSQRGCSKAISIGLSQYFVSYFFRDAPTIGETYSNDFTGIKDCGVSRSLKESQNLSLSEAFSACKERGYVYPMGTLYASIWWNIWQQILVEEPQKTDIFQDLYLEHLKGLRGGFDFFNALELIIDVDEQQFDSQFSSYFKDEFTRRGL